MTVVVVMQKRSGLLEKQSWMREVSEVKCGSKVEVENQTAGAMSECSCLHNGAQAFHMHRSFLFDVPERDPVTPLPRTSLPSNSILD